MKKSYQDITVLVDMDDTIEHLLPAWAKWLNERYSTNVQPEDITDWRVEQFFPTIPSEEVYAPLHDDTFWATVQPREDAIHYLSKLNDLRFNIYICTSSGYDTLKSKLENILDKHFPFLSWERVINTSNKQLLKADILVDDGVHNLVGGSYKKILMTVPHNQAYNERLDDIVRVHNWREAYTEIVAYADELIATSESGELRFVSKNEDLPLRQQVNDIFQEWAAGSVEVYDRMLKKLGKIGIGSYAFRNDDD